MSKKFLNRITIDLPADLHKEIKIAAATYERSLRDIIIEALNMHPYFYKSIVNMILPSPIVKDRDPNESDLHEVGTFWLNKNSHEIFISEFIENGRCIWKKYNL